MTKTNYKPDNSAYLAHFTKGREPDNTDTDNLVLPNTVGKDAFERLKSILSQKKIIASKLPWNNKSCVCLTESPWTSLLTHANNYSPFGIGFSKARIFAAGGAPALYVRPDLYSMQHWESPLHAFTTPFNPEYRDKRKDSSSSLKITVDYAHEREWRVPRDFKFEYSQIEFVVVEKYEHMAQMDRAIKDAIGEEKFIIMDNYKLIEKLWPVHNIGQ